MSVRVPNLIECFTGWVVDMSNCWMLGGLQEGSSEIYAKILFGKVIFIFFWKFLTFSCFICIRNINFTETLTSDFQFLVYFKRASLREIRGSFRKERKRQITFNWLPYPFYRN